jgi:hypothetical protein
MNSNRVIQGPSKRGSGGGSPCSSCNADKEPLFSLEDGCYRPTLWARGPWSSELLHGGPPALLLARALEDMRDDPDLLISRLTVDLMRPVRMAPLHTSVQRIREGRRIRLLDAFLHDGDQVVARATSLMLKRNAVAPAVPITPLPARLKTWQELETSIPERGPNMADDSDDRRFHLQVDMRFVPRTAPDQAFAAWLHVPFGLLPDQGLTPFQHTVAAADYVSPIGGMANPGRRGFINADFTLNLSRDPVGEWVCLESIGRPDHAGIATSAVNLYDEAGLLGSVTCSCVFGAAG